MHREIRARLAQPGVNQGVTRMMLITWNIQWCRGCDGRVDPARIIDQARAMGDFDVLCLQEVADNFGELAGSQGENQFEVLAGLLPGFQAFAGIGVDRIAGNGRRQRFGNLILSRLPVLSVWQHLLPFPAATDTRRSPGMPRVAIEVVLDLPGGPLRVLTTHLEYYSARQRAAQVMRLRELHEQACGHSQDAATFSVKPGPFEPAVRPVSAVLTADFNYRPDDDLHRLMQQPFAMASVPAWQDAWTLANPGIEHAPTVGCFDRQQWPAAFACDFIYVTQDLAPRVRQLRVNGTTDASDHQPVMLELA